MAITVYDRDGQAWLYERGVSTEIDPDYPSSVLDIVDSDGYVVGRFNSAAWTHLVVAPEPKPAQQYIFNGETNVDDALSLKGMQSSKQALQYPKR